VLTFLTLIIPRTTWRQPVDKKSPTCSEAGDNYGAMNGSSS